MKKELVCYWYRVKNTPEENNWGDALNPVMIKLLSGVTPTYIYDIPDYKNYTGDIYSSIGSILDRSDSRFIVWGSGFISQESKVKAPPKHINAVRGPLTRQVLQSQGIDCPEVFGDPALLYPRFYNPKIAKKYKIGIIPHYIDHGNEFLNRFKNDPEVKIINILSPTINGFIDDILSCDVIFSSSLHGIIAADAYGVPSYWIKFTDKLKGGRFKFDDYFTSVNRKIAAEYQVKENTTKADLLNLVEEYKIEIDLDKLYNACPYLNIA